MSAGLRVEGDNFRPVDGQAAVRIVRKTVPVGRDKLTGSNTDVMGVRGLIIGFRPVDQDVEILRAGQQETSCAAFEADTPPSTSIGISRP